MTKTSIIGTEEDNVYERGKALAKKVNREFELKEKAAARQARQQPKKQRESIEEQPPKTQDGKIITLDEMAAEGGRTKTQNAWINHWNNVEDGRWFPSMADLYHAFKQIVANPEDCHLTLLQQDISAQYFLTSTRIKYETKGLQGSIIHNYKSKMQKPSIKLKIHEYNDKKLEEVLGEPEGLQLVHSLLSTKDKPEQIIKVFEYISGNVRDNIHFSTVEVSGHGSRAEDPERAVSIICTRNYCCICCHNDLPYGNGRSRGVTLK